MEEDKIITEAKAIPNREAVEEFAVRGAMIKCSFGTGFDVINLPLCHGVYSGENPLLNISDMEVGKNIFGFGMCLDGKSECKCKEYIAINDKWMNPNETKLKIEKNEALLTGAQTACTSKGGIITITHSGQNAHYIKAAADQAKAIKTKKEAKATLDADTSSNDESVSKEVEPSIASDLASRSIVGGLGAIVSAGAFVDNNTAPSDNLEQKIVTRTSKNSTTNTLESNDPMSKVFIPSMIGASVSHIMKDKFDNTTPSYANIGVNSDYVAIEKASQDEVFVLPVDPEKYSVSITSLFGWSNANGSPDHKGWDIGASSAVDIRSMGYGTVKEIYTQDNSMDGRGQYIIIEHEYQGKVFYSEYMHLSIINVGVGDIIKSEETRIGKMGNSGWNGMYTYNYFHLHYQTFTDIYDRNGSAFDPFSGKMYGNKISDFENGLFGLNGIMPTKSSFMDMGYSSINDLSAAKNMLNKNIDEGLDYSNYFKKNLED